MSDEAALLVRLIDGRRFDYGPNPETWWAKLKSTQALRKELLQISAQVEPISIGAKIRPETLGHRLSEVLRNAHLIVTPARPPRRILVPKEVENEFWGETLPGIPCREIEVPASLAVSGYAAECDAVFAELTSLSLGVRAGQKQDCDELAEIIIAAGNALQRQPRKPKTGELKKQIPLWYHGVRSYWLPIPKKRWPGFAAFTPKATVKLLVALGFKVGRNQFSQFVKNRKLVGFRERIVRDIEVTEDLHMGGRVKLS